MARLGYFMICSGGDTVGLILRHRGREISECIRKLTEESRVVRDSYLIVHRVLEYDDTCNRFQNISPSIHIFLLYTGEALTMGAVKQLVSMNFKKRVILKRTHSD